MQGDQWKQVTLQTALLYPGIVFAIFLGLDFLVWGQKSSGAVPFGTMFALCFLWFDISVPLVFVGSYFGYRKPAPEDPVRTNKIPRQIPEQVGPAALVAQSLHALFSYGAVLPCCTGCCLRCAWLNGPNTCPKPPACGCHAASFEPTTRCSAISTPAT